MPGEVVALLGALAVLVFHAGDGRMLFIARFRTFGFGVGLLTYALAAGPALAPRPGLEWVSTATHAAFVLAGAGALWRQNQHSRQRRSNANYDPDAASEWIVEGRILLRRFLARDDLEALEQAVEIFRRAARATVSHSSHLTHVASLLTALHARYERLRRLDDLDEAIDIGREIARTGYRGGARRALVLSLLSASLRLRYDHVGGAGDLAEAGAACRTAVRLVPFRSRHFPACSHEFASALQSEYALTQERRLLDLAIGHIQRSLRSARRRGSARPVDLTTLCALLAERGRSTGSLRDLGEAIDAGRLALQRVPPTDRLFQSCQNALALALRTRFELRDRTAGPETAEKHRYELRPRVGDLDEAIRLAHRATESVSPDAPQGADHRLNLALALHSRYRYERAHADDGHQAERTLGWALEAARDAANHALADAPTRVRAGLAWSDIAASSGRHTEAVTAFEGVIGLLPRIASLELGREDQEVRLGQWTGIATRAAACALSAGQPEKALVLLEQGRGVLLSRALDVRADLTKLQARNPTLAAEFDELRESLSTAYTLSAGFEGELGWADGGTSAEPAPDVDDRARRIRRAQVERWEHLLERIRAEDGFSDFATTPSLERILAQGADGPVVYLNVSEDRADAIIVRPDGVITRPLPITLREVADRTRELQLAVGLDRILDPSGREAVYDVLAWLWKYVVDPVLKVAGLPEPDPEGAPPRVWWIPTGALTMLPIHAAGLHAEKGDSLLDRAVSSYAPTIRALAAVRERRAARTAPRPLVIAMSRTPGEDPLENAKAEAEMVCRLFPDSTQLENERATRQRTLDELQRHTWVHFACHGVIDPDIPSRSRLLLHDHQARPLTTADVSRLDLAEPAVAYLSSCETARTGSRHADEAIHLASAFQLAGFPDVIATLWKIPDLAAREFARNTYSALDHAIRSDTALNAARAVHEAARRARTDYPNLPGLWAGYVHMGR